MKPFEWNDDKNLLIKATRGMGFEDAARAILAGKALVTVKHPNQQKYPEQKIFVVLIKNYCYVVPYVENDEVIFLKTIYPSRKAFKKYLSKPAKGESAFGGKGNNL